MTSWQPFTRLYHRRAIAGMGAYGQRTMRTIQEPDEHVARTVWQAAIDRQGHSHPIAELADGFFRGGADGDDAGHGFERCLEDCLRSEERRVGKEGSSGV